MTRAGPIPLARTRPAHVAISGLGVVSPLGIGCDALWTALAEGRDGIRPIDRFSTEPFSVNLAATVPGWAPRGAGRAAIEYASVAAREAWTEARLGDAAVDPGRIAVVLGTSLGSHEEGLHQITEIIADEIGAAGPRLTVSVACTSSTNALGVARDLLAAGTADVVLAGGTDVLTDELFAGFHALGVLSREACAPFSDPPGTTLGEGAGFVVLEAWEAPARRGVAPLAALLGYGLSADAFHATAPDPSGSGVTRAIRAALEDAGLAPGDVGYVNAHGTGTESNDAAEWRGIRAALGPAGDAVPVSSSKSFLGHAQGAAGILEAICTILALRHGAVPPTRNFKGLRPRCPPDPVGESRPRRHVWQYGVSLNAAFGGANAAVALGAARPPVPRLAERRDLFVAGLAAVGPHGSDGAALDAAFERADGRGGRVPPFRLDAVVRGADARGLDASSAYVAAAAALALADAGGLPRGSARERTGVVLGASRISPGAARDHRASIAARGLGRLSATAFSRMILNAPAGACARLLGLKGPTSTLAAGDGAGLVAVAYAAEILAWQRAADALVAVGVDELDLEEDLTVRGEGAGCLVLSTSPVPGAARLAGWAFAAPGDVAGAVASALGAAGMNGEDVDAVYGSVDGAALHPVLGRGLEVCDPARALGVTPSAGPAFAAVAAVRALRRGAAGAAVVAAAGGRSAACAIVVRSGGEP